MRGRKSGLLPLELAILETGLAFGLEGAPEFHGFRMSARLRRDQESPLFTTQGALYKALDRMERQGYLTSRWEDADIGVAEGRPRRRLYRVTSTGEAVARAERAAGPRVEFRRIPQP